MLWRLKIVVIPSKTWQNLNCRWALQQVAVKTWPLAASAAPKYGHCQAFFNYLFHGSGSYRNFRHEIRETSP